MPKSVIIIGAGLAGLSTGCYAQMNGFDTRILEAHDKPGGLCTSWKRKGYTFDGCIHHLAGSGPASTLLHSMWRELGALTDQPVVFHDALTRVEAADGRAFTVHTDLDQLEAHMLELSPQDGAPIHAYVQAARKLTGFDLLAVPAFGRRDLPTLARYLPMVMKWGAVTLDKYAEQFSDPFLRRAFPMIQYDFSGIPAIVNLNFLAGCYNRTLGWPLGGSLAFVRNIDKRYAGLGGEIAYRARVVEVLVENDRAVGVRLEDGSLERADIVVAAGDGHSTIYNLLKGRYVTPQIDAYYAAVPEAQDMNLTVSLGVARDMSHEPHALTYLFAEPRTILGELRDRINVEVFNFDAGMAPAGKTSLKITLKSKYAYWKELRADRARYNEQKQRVGEQVIAALAQRFPGLGAQVEVVDVATPVTVERYTGNWQGLQAWGAPKGGMATMVKGLSRTLPGLEGFHMVGQWAGAIIGVSTAAAMGRKLVQRLCKQEHKAFHVA